MRDTINIWDLFQIARDSHVFFVKQIFSTCMGSLHSPFYQNRNNVCVSLQDVFSHIYKNKWVRKNASPGLIIEGKKKKLYLQLITTKHTKMLSISFNSGTLIKLDNLIMSKTTYIMATAVLSDVH